MFFLFTCPRLQTVVEPSYDNRQKVTLGWVIALTSKWYYLDPDAREFQETGIEDDDEEFRMKKYIIGRCIQLGIRS